MSEIDVIIFDEGDLIDAIMREFPEPIMSLQNEDSTAWVGFMPQDDNETVPF